MAIKNHTVDIYIDDSTSKFTNLYVLASVTCFKKDGVGRLVKDCYDDVIGSIDTHKLPSVEQDSDFRKAGFHYCSDHAGIKNMFIEFIAEAPISAEIIFSNKLLTIDNKINFLKNQIRKLGQKYKNRKIRFFIEQGDYDRDIRKKIIVESPNVTIVPKSSESPLAIADYIAGIYRSYRDAQQASTTATTELNTETIAKRGLYNSQYVTVKNKINCIYDFDNNTYDSRSERVKSEVGGGNPVGHEFVSAQKRNLDSYLTSSLQEIPFSEIKSYKALAGWLGVSINFLEDISSKGIQPNQYSVIKIKKRRSTDYRKVVTIDKDASLERANKILSEALCYKQKTLISDNVFGYVPRRSIKGCAKIHLKNKYLLNIDIEDFFNSIKEASISDMFSALGCNPLIANTLTKVTSIQGSLPQGLYTSPFISNLCFIEVDKELITLAKEHCAEYTRYADDITFSSMSRLELLPKVQNILEKYNFHLNNDKTRYQKKGHAMFVTGLSINDPKMPRIPRKYKKRMRMTLYNLEKEIGQYDPKEYDYESSLLYIDNLQDRLWRLKGKASFVHAVEPVAGAKYFKKIFDLQETVKNL